ncbi:juvenile hormone esterase-like isoform X3 [Microplitis mediator]|uniref:juvenile hormone esterase-like isoform X3 n=1 Tax=Microplitis mediator TaxID=375433 RepID=UPI002553A2F7|nr:juvenile hormone esterase-like isoform X3 [Microplitis mediator]
MAAQSHYLKLCIFNLIICFNTVGIESLSFQLTSVIKTDKGPVRGEILTSADRKIKFSSFRGIRYGKPPVGYLRFKPPAEADPWTSIFDATSEGIQCPQMDIFHPNIYVGSEDCLNLNVYTPKTYFSSLFHRSISMSGSALCFWSITTTPEIQTYAHQVAHHLGYTVNNNTELLKLLRNESAENIVKATAKITSNRRPFRPVAENANIAGDSAFITKCFIEKFKTGNFNRLPHMMGFMAQEVLLYLTPLTKLKQSVKELRDKVALTAADIPLNLSPMVENIFGGSTENIFSNIIDNAINQMVQNLTDLLYTSAIDMKQKIMQQYIPIYYYRNSMVTNISYHKIYNHVDVEGASHVDDRLYLWRDSLINLPSDPQHLFNIGRDRLVKMWTNFAKFSNPTPLGNDDPVLNVTWTESGPGGYYLDINNDGLTMTQTRPTNDNIKNIQQAYFTVFEKYIGCQ